MAISKTLYSLVHQPSFRAKMILKNTFTFTFTGTLSRGFGLRSFRPKLTNLNILIIGKSVFVSVFVFVEWAFTVNLRPKKTPQAEISGVISGRKLLRPKPLESVPPQFFCPSPLPPPLQIKLGGPIAVNCSGIYIYIYYIYTHSSFPWVLYQPLSLTFFQFSFNRTFFQTSPAAEINIAF